MFGQTRWSPIEDMFNFQREADRLFNELWNESRTYPSRPAQTANPNVHTSEDNWRLEIPMPGIDPAHVSIEVAGSSIRIHAEQNGGRHDGEQRYRPDHRRAAIPRSGPRERDASARPAGADAAAEGQCQAAAHSDRRRRRVTEAVDHRITGTRRTGRTSAGRCAALRRCETPTIHTSVRNGDDRDTPTLQHGTGTGDSACLDIHHFGCGHRGR